MGLDLIGYKDYVNNLKRFAQYNSDLGILSEDSTWANLPKETKIQLQVEFQQDQSKGVERV